MKCIVVNPVKEYMLLIVHCSFYSGNGKGNLKLKLRSPSK